MRKSLFFALVLALASSQLKIIKAQNQDTQPNMSIYSKEFGRTSDGQPIKQYRCKNSNGLSMTLIEYGATMTALETPDRDGNFANIILACDSVSGYEKCQSYLGCIAGRYCNRIAKGKFELGGKAYTLKTNNGPNHLHGGEIGFHRAVWQSQQIYEPEKGLVGVRFTHVSNDGDEGYPGQLTVRVDYLLNDNNEMTVDFEARSDRNTICNLTNHNYWNLGGVGSGEILRHQLMVNAKQFLPVDDTMIPTGRLQDVAGTELDFAQLKTIGKDIDSLKQTHIKGYDHCFAIAGYDGKSLKMACLLKDPNSGRTMEIHTDQPGLQFYTGNFLDGTDASGGHGENSALCLETQKYPDSPNQPSFPTATLKAGDTYRHKTVHKFVIDQNQSSSQN